MIPKPHELSDVSRETSEMLEVYAEMVRAEAKRQNLVSPTTIDAMWDRHIIDSAQLLVFASAARSWVDIGSGAGLPGIPLAILAPEVTFLLVEPRRLRAEFLHSVAETLGLDNVTIVQAKAERVEGRFDAITGRAVACLDRFLSITHHLSHPGTLWVLPKGRNAISELEVAQRSWHCVADIEPSCTDPDSRILVLRRVRKTIA